MILVDHATQDTMPADRRIERDHDGRVVIGRLMVQTLVRTVLIEVPDELSQHGSGVAFVVNEHPVGALRANAAHEPFGVTVRPRRPRRCSHHVDAFGGEHRVERREVLGVPVPDQETGRLATRSLRSITRFRATCVVHAPVGCAVTPRMWTRRVRTSITKNTYSRRSPIVSRWKSTRGLAAPPCRVENMAGGCPADVVISWRYPARVEV